MELARSTGARSVIRLLAKYLAAREAAAREAAKLEEQEVSGPSPSSVTMLASEAKTGGFFQ